MTRAGLGQTGLAGGLVLGGESRDPRLWGFVGLYKWQEKLE